MTKEKLEKEVEAYLKDKYCENVCTCDEVEECKEGIRIRCMSFNFHKDLIVNFAEPREKCIAELEQQIEKMKCCHNCDFMFRDGNCYYDKECKNKDHWKLREIKEK